MTCLRLDWRTYSRAALARWAAVTFDDAVSVNTGCSFPAPGRAGSRGGQGSGAGERDGDGGQDVDELGGHRARQRAGGARAVTAPHGVPGVSGAAAGVRRARARRQAVTPLPVSTPSPSGNALARACRAA